MKKYTLKFKDQSLELQYQKEYNTNVRYPLCKWLFLILFIAISISTIFAIINLQYYYLAIDGLLILFAIGSLILAKKYKHLCQIFLIIVIIIALLLALSVQFERSQTSQLIITSIMITAVSIAYTIDLTIANFLILQVQFLEMLILNLNGETVKSTDYIYSIATLSYFIYCRYKVEVSNRNQFLFNLKDKEWTGLLSRIIKQPFIFFYFDETDFAFMLRTASQQNSFCSNNEELRQFLRTAKILGNSLEQFLFQQKDQPLEIDQCTTTSLKIHYEKVIYKIEVSKSYVQNQSFLIVFDQESEKIKSLKLKSVSHNQKLRDNVQHYQRSIFKILKQSLFLQDGKTIGFLRKFLQFHLLQCLSREISKNNFTIQNLNLLSIAQEIQILFKKQISLDYSRCRLITINSILPLVQLLFLDVFRKMKYDQINITICSDLDCLVLNLTNEDLIYFEKIDQGISEQMGLIIRELAYFMCNNKIVGIEMHIYKEAMLSF